MILLGLYVTVLVASLAGAVMKDWRLHFVNFAVGLLLIIFAVAHVRT